MQPALYGYFAWPRFGFEASIASRYYTSSARSLTPPFQITTAALGCNLIIINKTAFIVICQGFHEFAHDAASRLDISQRQNYTVFMNGTKEYSFTEKGRDSMPVFYQIMGWGFKHEND